MLNLHRKELMKELYSKKEIIEGNILYNADCFDVFSEIENNTIDLVVADPPYFKVVNQKWDYEWRTEEDYIKWCLAWMSEIHRVLRIGGTFYLFGYFRILALLVPYLKEMGFNLRQQILVDKGMRSVSGRATKNYKLFPNTTESILFITKENRIFLKDFLKGKQKELGLTSSEINHRLGVKTNGGGMWSIYAGKNICEQFPTEEMWDKLKDILEFDLEYKSVAQTFNSQMGLTDVWRDVDFYEEERIHPTQKPVKLIERLILASSDKGDLVLDPFGGSASTGIASLNTDRRFILFEKDEKYFDISVKRMKGEIHKSKSRLF